MLIATEHVLELPGRRASAGRFPQGNRLLLNPRRVLGRRAPLAHLVREHWIGLVHLGDQLDELVGPALLGAMRFGLLLRRDERVSDVLSDLVHGGVEPALRVGQRARLGRGHRRRRATSSATARRPQVYGRARPFLRGRAANASSVIGGAPDGGIPAPRAGRVRRSTSLSTTSSSWTGTGPDAAAGGSLVAGSASSITGTSRSGTVPGSSWIGSGTPSDSTSSSLSRRSRPAPAPAPSPPPAAHSSSLEPTRL